MAETTTKTVRLLVVGRESSALRPLSSVAESHGWQIETAVTGWDAMERVQSGITPNLVLLDLPQDNKDSLHVLRWLRRLRPELSVIVTCSPNDSGQRNEALRLGAQDFLVRPLKEGHLEAAIQRYLMVSFDEEMEIASEDIEQVGPGSYFVSSSPVTKKLYSQAELLAETDVPVLILGESGSGKETVARLIHKLSVRSAFKFLKVNCSDMPTDLLEAELFGIERGGAKRSGPGLLERREKGTIFLDEIAEMPLDLQNKLIQMMDGSDAQRQVRMRLIAATKTNIDRAVAERRLREDLYYRFSAFTVQIPPLRQRKFEIAILLHHLMHKLSKHYGLPPRQFSSEVLMACQQYSWPGNLKELENFVKRCLIGGDTELVFDDVEPRSRATGSNGLLHAGGDDLQALGGPRSLRSLMRDVRNEAERSMIATALQKTGWNRKAAARLLQVSYRTLLYKIDQYHMKASDSHASPQWGSTQSSHDNNAKTR